MAPWSTKDGSIYTRPIGENEDFMKIVTDAGLPLGREHWSVSCKAAIAPYGDLAAKPLQTVLRDAWRQLRFEHPGIAIRASPGKPEFSYDVPYEGKLADWTSETFIVKETAGSASEVISKIEPFPSARLFFVPQSKEVVLHASHWLTDGVGIVQLMDAYLELASKHAGQSASGNAWGKEVERLAPPVEDALRLSSEPTPAQKALAESLVAKFALEEGSVRTQYLGDATTLPGGTAFCDINFGEVLTREVVAACKARDISVTAAVHASVAAANWALASDRYPDGHFCSTIRFNLRPYLHAPYNTPAYAAGLYTTGWMDKVEKSSAWRESARHYDALYRAGLSDEFLQSHREYAKGLCTLLRSVRPSSEPPSSIDISSIGILENLASGKYGDESSGLEVHRITVGVENITRQGTLLVSTFRSQLNFHLCYNEVYHSSQQMESFMSSLRSSLLQNLDIKE